MNFQVLVLQVLGPPKPGRRIMLVSEPSPLAIPPAAECADVLIGPASAELGADGRLRPALSLDALIAEIGEF